LVQTLFALKSAPVVMVTVRAPSPLPVVNGPNVHDDFSLPEVSTAVCAPLRLTHLASDDVTTVSVTVWPCLT
jgi:hypothetical protein